jgi:hypothetical protein
VNVGVSEGVKVGVKVDVWVGDGVNVHVGEGVKVLVGVAVDVQVKVGVMEGVEVGVSVGVEERVGVYEGVSVGVGVPVGVAVNVGDIVGVSVGEGTGVSVGAGASPDQVNRKMSSLPLLSSATRFEAADWKATTRPSAETAGCEESPSSSKPICDLDNRTVQMGASMLRRKTSSTPLRSSRVIFVADDEKAT